MRRAFGVSVRPIEDLQVCNKPANGNAVEPKTGRKFFLDYPCDLKPGDPVLFVTGHMTAMSYWLQETLPGLAAIG